MTKCRHNKKQQGRASGTKKRFCQTPMTMTGIRIMPVLTVLLIGWFLMAGALRAADQKEIPDEIMIDGKAYASDKKGPVKFSHLDHAENYDVTCAECHHVYKDGKNVWEEGQPVQKCVECHDAEKSEGNVKKLQIAFHQNCKDCHRDLVKEGISEEAPYKKCNDCHEKK